MTTPGEWPATLYVCPECGSKQAFKGSGVCTKHDPFVERVPVQVVPQGASEPSQKKWPDELVETAAAYVEQREVWEPGGDSRLEPDYAGARSLLWALAETAQEIGWPALSTPAPDPEEPNG